MDKNGRLVEGLRSGREGAFKQLFEMYFGRLVREAQFRFHLREEDAEELADDALLKAIQSIDAFRFRNGDSDFHCWLMTIFRNKASDLLRRASKGKEIRVDPLDENHADTCDDRRELCNNQMLRHVADVLDSMEPWERVLLLCRAEGMPYAEIEQYAGKSAEQLKVYHRRVQERFMRLLREQPSLLPSFVTTSGRGSEEKFPRQ